MALDVKVKIELSKTAGSVGFGTPLLLTCGEEIAEVKYTECADLEAVEAAGFAAGTDMYKAATKMLAQTNRPEKIAVCAVNGAAVEALPDLISKGWRQLVLVGVNSTEYISVADYIETTKDKMFFVSMAKAEFETFKSGLAGKKYDRTVIFVSESENAAAALVGETAGRTVGSFTYKFKSLKDVAADDLTDSEIDALHANGAFGYVTKAGDDVTTEGISQSGKYIDITDSIDYVIQNIEYRVQKAFNNSPKLPYDDRGIAVLDAAVTSALQNAGNNGIIAVLEDGTYDYTVSFAPRAQTTEADRESRVYKYGSFAFALSGAIHEAIVNGVVTA